MSLDFVSGLLLATVTLAALFFLIKEIVGERFPDHKKTQRYLADVSAKLFGAEAKPVNEHLIGSTGKVIAHSDDSGRPLRVRLGPELWAARLESTEGARLPVGTAVKVMAVDGAVLVVAAETEPAEPPPG